jgi:hypothetical protein
MSGEAPSVTELKDHACRGARSRNLHVVVASSSSFSAVKPGTLHDACPGQSVQTLGMRRDPFQRMNKFEFSCSRRKGDTRRFELATTTMQLPTC